MTTPTPKAFIINPTCPKCGNFWHNCDCPLKAPTPTLVERLRELYRKLRVSMNGQVHYPIKELNEAAAHIERLEGALRKVESDLRDVGHRTKAEGDEPGRVMQACMDMRAALEGT